MQLETGKDALIDLKQSLSKGNYIVSYSCCYCTVEIYDTSRAL